MKVRELTDIYRKSYSTVHFEKSLSIDMIDSFGRAYLDYNFSISNPKVSYAFSQMKEMKIEGTETGASPRSWPSTPPTSTRPRPSTNHLH